MFLKLKEGDILSPTQEVKNARVLVGYAKEGGSPLFVIMEHGGAVLLSTEKDPEFHDTVKTLGL